MTSAPSSENWQEPISKRTSMIGSKLLPQMFRQRFRLRSVSGTALMVATLLAAAGCVERRLTIRTDPPGARVYIDDYEIGTSPCSTHFTYYGTRKIRLVKDGFRTKTLYQPLPPPWYQIPPIDFVTENLLPGKFRDHRTLVYELEPEVITPGDELLRRAEGMRQQVLTEAGTHVVPADRVAPPRMVAPPLGPGSTPTTGAPSYPGTGTGIQASPGLQATWWAPQSSPEPPLPTNSMAVPPMQPVPPSMPGTPQGSF
jgi:hypothetical protein